jgi:citrate/tricarballylate utilization protein
MQTVEHSEAVRQLSICNSCRYCEGYCAAFKGLTRYREFDEPTVSHLANLCHNCRGCYYACQYTEPHEFAINIPALLANIRAQNWEQHIRPQWLSRVMQRYVWPYIVLSGLFMVLFSIAAGVPWLSAQPFYSSLSHTVLVLMFTPLFLIPLISLGFGIRRYWRVVGGQPLKREDLAEAFKSAATLKQLSGGQGQGCNYESEDRFTLLRRWSHQATMYGFLLCFASTSMATIFHYALGLSAPYEFFSVPKLLGVSGGLLLSFGTAALAVLKWRSDDALGSHSRVGGEYTFIALLFLVSTTGLLLYWFSGTVLASAWLIVHLAFIATFFIATPYSKMAHGFFRLAALCREAQLKRLQST